MPKVCLINIVGLTPSLIGGWTPNIAKVAQSGFLAPMSPVFPAVTSSAQATMLTGLAPAQHGIVGNGWYNRELGEVHFWKQSNALVGGEKIYETAKKKDPSFTCAKLFWWFNQGAQVDVAVTPKPYYGADGSKAFAIQSYPTGLGAELEDSLGGFPFQNFWGPKSGLQSSEWIAQCAVKVIEKHDPNLTLVYLPHLDYDLQRFGSTAAKRCAAEVDAAAAPLIELCMKRGITVVIVSEYGLTDVSKPVHINRALRKAGLLQVRPGPFGETLETFASQAFAVADHQVAHIYVNDKSIISKAIETVRELDGVYKVVTAEDTGLAHPRAGDLIAFANKEAWFTYYYWLEDNRAPDFARTVDIHRKPGYDPCELFFDPNIAVPEARVGLTLVKKKIGFRYLMKVVPLDATLVKGSHGLADGEGPAFICSDKTAAAKSLKMTDVKELIHALLR